MFGLSLNPTFLAMHANPMPEEARFTMKRLSPYMTQPITVRLYPEPETLPVLSAQLAHQLNERRKSYPELRAFRWQRLNTDDGWPVPDPLERLENVKPGKILLMMANLRRGLGDMILLLPILRAQAKRLRNLGWEGRIAISTSSEFEPLVYGQEFVETFLPEIPSLSEILAYDYVMEYGEALRHMKHHIGISDWIEIDLKVDLHVPEERVRRWRSYFDSNKDCIFVNWQSLDKHRSLSTDFFVALKTAFPQYTFFTSVPHLHQQREIFPGGPINLWPQQNDLHDLTAILQNMRAVVTTNTGTAHMAGGLGRPTVVLFSGRLYGWDDYWPTLHQQLYPSMHTVGLRENLQITEAEMLEQTIAVLRKILGCELRIGIQELK